MMLTVEELKELFIDGDSQRFHIWDNDKEEVIFKGFGGEITDDLLDEEITSIDNMGCDSDGVVTINIR